MKLTRKQVEDLVDTLSVSPMYEKSNGNHVVLEAEPGETIARRVRKNYFQLVEDRTVAADLTLVPILRQYVVNCLLQMDEKDAGKAFLLLVGIRHLDNAANENLSLAAREVHFDIAYERIVMVSRSASNVRGMQTLANNYIRGYESAFGG